ncbi:MAG: ATP-dependent zinc metalloprotease FtsH [Pseudomonadota bacterium]
MARQDKKKQKPPHKPFSLKEGRNIGSIILWGLLILIGLYAIRQHLAVGSAEIRYDQFKKLVSEDRVKEVKIGADEILVVLKDGASVESIVGKEHAQKAPKALKVVRIPDIEDDIVGQLEKHGVPFAGVKTSDSWLPLILWGVMPLVVLIFLWRTMFRKIGGGASGALSFGKSKAKIKGEQDIRVTFEDVAGVDEAKEELKEIIQFLKHPQKYIRIGARIPKGVLLVGPPGTGKTLMARAVAGEAKVPFFSISGSEFVEMFVGVGAARVRDLFDQAGKQAPCIVFIDELDALGKSRGMGALMGNDEREQTLNQLLVEMDGFDANRGVIIMAATNRPEILDVALLRPGRFDRQVLVDRPDRRGREAILRVHARDVKISESVDLAAMAAQTPGFAGADLANVVNEAALLAARRGKEEVEQKDLAEAVERVVAGLEKKSRIITEDEKKIVAHHEIGHALVSEFTEGADNVTKISIVPRGLAALGYTMQMPTEDRYLMRRSELMAKIAGLMGGRAAEMLIFDEVSTGAQNDLQRATEIARAMVVDFGMSFEIGPLSVGRRRRAPFIDEMSLMGQSDKVSDELARKVDEEIDKIMREAWDRAYGILKENEELLRHLAKILIEKEYLEEKEFESIIAQFPKQKPIASSEKPE